MIIKKVYRVSLKEFKSGTVLTGFICICALCAGLFSLSHYMGWLEQDSGFLGSVARAVYGPDVRREMARLEHIKSITPEIRPFATMKSHRTAPMIV